MTHAHTHPLKPFNRLYKEFSSVNVGFRYCVHQMRFFFTDIFHCLFSIQIIWSSHLTSLSIQLFPPLCLWHSQLKIDHFWNTTELDNVTSHSSTKKNQEGTYNSNSVKNGSGETDPGCHWQCSYLWLTLRGFHG